MWSKTIVENLLSEWLRKPYQCARGGLCYSWRKWGSGDCVTSIRPNDRGWHDPATYKLFAEIRDLGWGLVVKQAVLARMGIKEVVLIPPSERRYRDMDRPKAIFNHADLGTREPADPELRGYDPGHPWFYILGGRPLRPEEIEPDREWELPSDVKLDRLKDPDKRRKRLLEMRKDYEERLQADIRRYQQVVTPGYEVNSYDRSMGYGLETSLFLCHNHILSDKMWLAAINQELNRELAKASPLLGADSRVEPHGEISHPAIPVRETSKPKAQPKEPMQLRLF
jgi:hypothetical protein